MIRCAHCGDRHETVAEVRACYLAGAAGPTPVEESPEDGPTTEQVIILRHFLATRVVPTGYARQLENYLARTDRKPTFYGVATAIKRCARLPEKVAEPVTVPAGPRTFAEVAPPARVAHTGKVVKCPDCGVRRNMWHLDGCSLPLMGQDVGAERGLTPAPVPARGHARISVTEDGMYRTPDGVIYKVQWNRGSGSGRNLYAKRLVVECEPVYKVEGVPASGIETPAVVRFEYAPGALRTLDAGWKLTIEQAREFGALYGTCVRCGRTLTAEDSIERMMGPVCYGNMVDRVG